METNKIVQVHWIGRFGNRLFEYAYGCCYARKYGLVYYMPSEWEGVTLFNPNFQARIQPNDLLRQKINQSHKDMDTIAYRREAVAEYNRNNNDNINMVNFHDVKVLGQKNIFFDDLNMMYFQHCFDIMEMDYIKREVFKFSDAIKQSELYKTLEKKKGTYDVIHLRRGDIASLSYKGAHSMVSKRSYIKALEKYGYDISKFVWVSDDHNERTGHEWLDKCKGGNWRYPVGEKVMPDVFFDFFPEFLIIYFARTVFRGNSAFSWWASALGDAKVFSPVLTDKPKDKKNSYYEMDCEFIEGNHPHFMGSRGEGFKDIMFK